MWLVPLPPGSSKPIVTFSVQLALVTPIPSESQAPSLHCFPHYTHHWGTHSALWLYAY